MRGFRAVVLCSCLWVSCISDLKPDVGPLAVPDQDVGNGSGEEGGAANGSATGAEQPENEAGASSDPDAGQTSPAPDSGPDMPGPGPGPAPVGCSKDSDGKKTVSFAKQIRPILYGCRCHDPENEDPFAILESGLTIADYKTLRKGGDLTGVEIIVDGNACDSLLVQKLSEAPPFGDRMPREGPYLTLAERTLISDWILEGARDN